MSEKKKTVVINGESLEVGEAEDMTEATLQELSNGRGDDE